MPIRPENRGRYPADWKAISIAIRERAGQVCEFCQIAHNGKPHPVTGSKVILTVAHLDHQPENCDSANLAAMCQKCHLTYDAQHHARNAAQTRRATRADGDLFD